MRVTLSGAGCSDAWVPDRPPLPPRFPPMMDSKSCDRKGRFRIGGRRPLSTEPRPPGTGPADGPLAEARGSFGLRLPLRRAGSPRGLQRGRFGWYHRSKGVAHAGASRDGEVQHVDPSTMAGAFRAAGGGRGAEGAHRPVPDGQPQGRGQSRGGARRPDPDLARSWRPRRRCGGDRPAHRRDGRVQLRDRPRGSSSPRRASRGRRSRGSSTAAASCSTGRCGSS